MKNYNRNDKFTLLWLWHQLASVRLYIGALTVLRMCMGLVGIGYAVLLKHIVDRAAAADREGVLLFVSFFILLVLIQIAMQCVFRHVSEYARSSGENSLKRRLFSTLLQKNYSQVTATHSGEWLSRLTSDTVIVSDSVMQILPGFAGMAVQMLISMAVLFVYVPVLAAAFLILGGGLVLSTFWLRKKLKALHTEIQKKDGRLRVFLTEHLSSLMMVKAYQQEAYAVQAAGQAMADHQAARMKKIRFSNLCNGGFVLALNGSVALGVAYCGFGILSGAVSYGTFVAVLQLIMQLRTPASGITGFIPQYFSMLASTERLMEAEQFTEDKQISAPVPAQWTGFGLDRVSFAYPDAEDSSGALHLVSIHIEKGQYVAFTGPSGCGKSTVLKLLLCLYAPDAGTVYVQAQGQRQPLSKPWNELFAYVPQGNQLMNDSIRNIVSFSDPADAANTEKILTALKIACAEEFVRALPDGIDTVLKERGTGLSEGQMQRIAIARALCSNRPVLLLDEATSALDPRSEIQLLENIRKLTDKTVILVTHRPAALKIADRVAAFSEDGTLAAP